MQNASKNQYVWPPAVNHILSQGNAVPRKLPLQGILSVLLSMFGVLLLVIGTFYDYEVGRFHPALWSTSVVKYLGDGWVLFSVLGLAVAVWKWKTWAGKIGMATAVSIPLLAAYLINCWEANHGYIFH